MRKRLILAIFLLLAPIAARITHRMAAAADRPRHKRQIGSARRRKASGLEPGDQGVLVSPGLVT
jgi:hypothetical protein